MIVALFAIQNATQIEVNFLFTTFETSLAVIIFLSTAVGGFIVMTLGFFREIKLKMELKSARKIASSLENDIRLMEEDFKKKDEEILMLKEDFLKKEESEKIEIQQ